MNRYVISSWKINSMQEKDIQSANDGKLPVFHAFNAITEASCLH